MDISPKDGAGGRHPEEGESTQRGMAPKLREWHGGPSDREAPAA